MGIYLSNKNFRLIDARDRLKPEQPNRWSENCLDTPVNQLVRQ